MGMKRTGKGLSGKWKEHRDVVVHHSGGVSHTRSLSWEDKKRLREAMHSSSDSGVAVERVGDWWRVRADLFYAGNGADTFGFKEEEVREIYSWTKQAVHILQGAPLPVHMNVNYSLKDGDHEIYVEISSGREVRLPLSVNGGVRIRTDKPEEISGFNDWERYSGNPLRKY